MTKAAFSLIGLAALISASPAFAVDVKKSVDVSASPDAAWKAIGDFCGIGKWHPAIAKCEISEKDGATYRTLTLKGGGEVYEKKLAWDDAGRAYTYAIERSPLPVADDYTATMAVVPNGSGATINWTAHFTAKGAPDDKAAETIGGIFDGGLASLKTELK
jgi:hypothetical protein